MLILTGKTPGITGRGEHWGDQCGRIVRWLIRKRMRLLPLLKTSSCECDAALFTICLLLSPRNVFVHLWRSSDFNQFYQNRPRLSLPLVEHSTIENRLMHKATKTLNTVHPLPTAFHVESPLDGIKIHIMWPKLGWHWKAQFCGMHTSVHVCVCVHACMLACVCVCLNVHACVGMKDVCMSMYMYVCLSALQCDKHCPSWWSERVHTNKNWKWKKWTMCTSSKLYGPRRSFSALPKYHSFSLLLCISGDASMTLVWWKSTIIINLQEKKHSSTVYQHITELCQHEITLNINYHPHRQIHLCWPGKNINNCH